MPAVTETPLAERAKIALDGIMQGPATQANFQKICTAARLLGIPPSRFSLDDLGSLGEAMYEKAIPFLRQATGEPAQELTGVDVKFLRKALEVVEALEVINAENPALAITAYSSRKDASIEFKFCLVGRATEQTQEAYIRGKLSADPEEAKDLIFRLRNLGLNVSAVAPELSQAVLCTDSNNKTRQEQREFYEHGLADGLQCVNLAIDAVLQARKAGVELKTIGRELLQEKGARVEEEAIRVGLHEGTATMLKMLTSGAIRIENPGSSDGFFHVGNQGRLYAYEHDTGPYSDYWAFGAAAHD